MASDVVTLPEWVTKLATGPPLPPEPYGGFGRWWRDNSDQLWIIIFCIGLGLAAWLIEKIGEEIFSEMRYQRIRKLHAPQ
jgi:hypothetical protein